MKPKYIQRAFLIDDNLPMICGSSDANIHVYKKLIGKSGHTWLVSIDSDAADNVYASANSRENAPGYAGFRGFGGSTLEFKLDTGEKMFLKGPWASNADGLYEDTGYDVRNKHLTYGAIGVERDDKGLTGILYKDKEPTLGSFHRLQRKAREFANELNIPVFCYSKSHGGSSNDMVEPHQKFYWDKED